MSARSSQPVQNQAHNYGYGNNHVGALLAAIVEAYPFSISVFDQYFIDPGLVLHLPAKLPVPLFESKRKR